LYLSVKILQKVGTPNKIFIAVPKGRIIRNQWCKLMRKVEVSPISTLYCCEDHFNVSTYVHYNLIVSIV